MYCCLSTVSEVFLIFTTQLQLYQYFKIFFLFALFSDKPEVFLPKYSQTAILQAVHFQRVVNEPNLFSKPLLIGNSAKMWFSSFSFLFPYYKIPALTYTPPPPSLLTRSPQRSVNTSLSDTGIQNLTLILTLAVTLRRAPAGGAGVGVSDVSPEKGTEGGGGGIEEGGGGRGGGGQRGRYRGGEVYLGYMGGGPNPLKWSIIA